jgi:UDP-N-acetylmuramate dehydrogenase
LSKIAAVALKHSLGGFEFAAGIPGTLGGAVVMNAGAFDGEMKDVVVSTRYIDETGELKETTEHGFGYRTSMFSAGRAIITESTLRLAEKNKDEIKSKMSLLAGKGVKNSLWICPAREVYLKGRKAASRKAYPGRRA